MRGAWLALCALSLARADVENPDFYAHWLEGFRRDLLREAYDYESDPKPSPTSNYTRAPNLNSTPQAKSDKPPDTSDATPLVGRSSRKASPRRPVNAVGVRSDRPLARYAVKHASHRSGSPLDAPDAQTIGKKSSKTGLAGDASVGYSSSKPPKRRTSEDMLVGHPTGELGRPLASQPTREPRDTASLELGISRRDLYGARGPGSITENELDAKRRPFLNSVSELDMQMRPVIIRSDPESAYRYADKSHVRQGRARKSGKRRWDENNEQNQDSPPYITDQFGIKLYKVNTNARDRFRNQFGSDTNPWFKEELGLGQFDERVGSNEAYQESETDLPQAVDRDRDSRGDSSQGVYSVSRERDVSEYGQENLRSRYLQDGRMDGDTAERFSARRDAALLADGLASSSKPCNCMTDTARIVPEL